MRRRALLFLFSIVLFGIYVFWPGTGTRWVEIDVVQGNTGYDVAVQLRDKGLLRTVHSFLFWSRVRGAGAKLKIGRYRFSQGRSAWWIVDDLVNGRTQKVRLVIPEGFASWQIAERVDELKLGNREEFLKTVSDKGLEGYLFPATYELDAGYSAAALAQIFVNRFDKEWTPEMDARAKSARMTKKDVVTLASIVEREAVVQEERPVIASVYLNRLKKRIPLQADPTVQYALGFWKQRLLYADYRNVKSPYNTYLNPGLPPGPICSPGLSSIEAVLTPAQTDYLYFVATDAGHHTFTSTYREHTNNVNKRNKQRRSK